MAVVTFSDLESAPVAKFLNLDPGPKNFQIWESESCSDSGCHRCNRNSPIPKKCHICKLHRLLLLKMKSDSGSRSIFSQIFYYGAGSENKTQDPPGVDSGTPDP